MKQVKFFCTIAVCFISAFCIDASDHKEIPFTKEEISASRYLTEWCDLWGDEPLTGESFTLKFDHIVRETVYDFTYEVEKVDSWELLSRLLIFSPDGKMAIDYNWGQIIRHRGRLLWGESPDSQIALMSVETWKVKLIISYGPSVRFDMGAWLNPTTFIVGGRNDVYGHDDCHLVVWKLDTETRTLYTYYGPKLTETEKGYVNRLSCWKYSRFPEIDWGQK